MIDVKNIAEISRMGFVDTSSAGYTSGMTDKKQTESPATMSDTVADKVNVGQVPGNREIDQALVERAQRGDQQAFGMLVEKYQRKLGRLLSRMVRDQAEVEDVVQESFIKAYRALPNFRGDSAFYTWLYRIGINTAKNYLVSLGRRPQVSYDVEIEDAENFEDAEELRTAETPETELMTKEIAKTVNETMMALPDELRTAITLRELEGLSYEEIATLMSCPIGTVRSRIFRARETIAAKLRPLLDTPDDKRW
ncbi:RNA polymerase sigma factor RpoE [Candidatus Methylopumilus turicensis]|uniref:RNA polymerase sigma factor n=1 Tax=Candidatus Methylopumilus turicensis TaxID=1581680 RepID=A0A0B7IV83_9PROT|nr:RNA polymerase, sigma 24 (sigma E) factor (modular protein) [Candidatus Methylopumilus turicensis]